ncbi:hypothetical protein SAMN04488483_5360 [Pseudomonas helmanticensis]|uniref:Uncharacterized protein n=1 Tax=Pseudomonas helmanticensis TaxID=1471381 RepID=A0ACD2UDF9_9PSED|nr:hypothetical protein [Pseudomonas helmanticensis]SMQ30362.1 hypothetical protein SAMN04488483_5360 [Pseudomonas helmanticensis]
MPIGKRESARIERSLITTLTDACETAKFEIQGFARLTHTADLTAFAETLTATWVFETQIDKKLALANTKGRFFELTAIALQEANFDVKPSDQTIRFDSEEECQHAHGGDWQKRLTRSRVAKGIEDG